MDGTGLMVWVGLNNAAGPWLGGLVVMALLISNEDWTSDEGESECNSVRYCLIDSNLVDVGQYH